MSTDPASGSSAPPAIGEDVEHFSLEVIARLVGVEASTVIHYQRQGFLQSTSCGNEEEPLFDVESVRRLRRIEHLRAEYGVNDAGVRLVLSLLQQVEDLNAERRRHPRR